MRIITNRKTGKYKIKILPEEISSVSIVIPQYSENEHVILSCLAMIDSQVFMDFSKIEVIIINDYSSIILSEEFLNQFNNIKPIYMKLKEPSGPGLARQVGLDIAKNDYIYFHDADDMLFGNNSLFSLLYHAQNYDIISGNVMIETEDKGLIEINNGISNVEVWGKVYRREFLIKNNIRFSEDPVFRWMSEDVYFNVLCNTYNPKKKHVDILAYVYKYNKNSLMRTINNHPEKMNFGYLAEIKAAERNPDPFTITCFFKEMYEDILEKKKKKISYEEDQKCLNIFFKKFKHLIIAIDKLTEEEMRYFRKIKRVYYEPSPFSIAGFFQKKWVGKLESYINLIKNYNGTKGMEEAIKYLCIQIQKQGGSEIINIESKRT